MQRDRGHVAVTGASAGIGAALARAFATGGNRLTLVARRRPLLEQLAAELDVPARVAVADMSELDACAAWMDGAEAEHGPIDVLICNAGIQYVERAMDVDDRRSERLMAINFHAPLRQARRVLPAMVARRSGTVVLTSSMAAITHTPYMAHYNASKAALSAYFETLRVELSDSGVNIVNVYPGPVASAMETAARERYPKNTIGDNIPMGKPDELARRVRQAVAKGRARVVYPSFYGLARYARVTSQWLANRLAPEPVDPDGG